MCARPGRTLINGLYKGWVIDVARGLVSKLATQQLEVFLVDVQCEEVEDATELHRRDHTTVAVGLGKTFNDATRPYRKHRSSPSCSYMHIRIIKCILFSSP